MTKLFTTRIALAIIAAGFLQGQTAGMREFAIVDPVLQMPAWTIPVPSTWKAEGTMLPPSSCNSSTTPVFKTVSPDGRTGAYLLPRIDWAWGAGVRPANDCLPWHEAVSPKDFLTYLMRIEKVGFVREVPVPDRGPDTARYLVRYYANGQLVDEMLTAIVTCDDTMVAGVGQQHRCFALVTRWFAPSGKLQAMVPTFASMHFALNQQWMDQWTAHMQQRMHDLYASQTKALLESGRLAGAQRMAAHQDFMTSFQQGADRRKAQFVAGQYRKQNTNDNYVDYILDCQRAYSGTTRVSSGNCPNRQTF